MGSPITVSRKGEAWFCVAGLSMVKPAVVQTARIWVCLLRKLVRLAHFDVPHPSHNKFHFRPCCGVFFVFVFFEGGSTSVLNLLKQVASIAGCHPS